MISRARHAGFTLLELLVVLVIAGLSVAVVGAGAQSFMDRASYHQTVREVAARLSQARMLCMQQGTSITVRYEPQSRQLLLPGKPPLVLPGSVQVNWEALPHNPRDSTDRGEPVFVFNAEGGAQGGRLVVARGGQGVAFRVGWLLGTVEQVATAGAS